MNSSKVAVLLAVYNGMQWLEEQVISILNQHSTDTHIFISVDLSTDNSFDYCNKLALSHSNITLLSYGKRYGGAAPNFYRLIRDVDFTSFDYIAFADQDDIWFESKLQNATSVLASKGVDAYSGNVIAFESDNSQSLIVKSQPQRRLDFIFESAGPGCTFVFTRDLALNFQFFLQNNPDANHFYLHDWLLYAFARSKGYNWFIDPIPYMLYRQHQTNQVGANNTFKSLLYRLGLAVNGSVSLYINQLLSLISVNSIYYIPSRMDFKSHLFFIFNWRYLRRRSRDRYFVLILLVFMCILYFPTVLYRKVSSTISH